jgi:hypothetical protein
LKICSPLLIKTPNAITHSQWLNLVATAYR